MKDIKVVAETTTTFSTFEKGDWIWFDPGYGYPMPGEVVDINCETRAAVVRSCLSQKDIFTIANFSHLQRRTNDIQNVEDLIQLEELSDASILWCLKTRYDKNKIYTYIGGILISVNPYRMFDTYGIDTVKKYRNQVLGTLPAHLFALGDATYSDMISSKSNQVIVISGESGSGKTETCKILMQYLALAVQSEQHKNEPGRRNVTTEQILDATPILESFGNARTIRNDNSSRFGKYTEILFKNRRIHGAEITEYLLEKSRIVSHNFGERNYHIFYELLSGLRPEMKDKFGLNSADKFFYLNQGKCLQIPGRSDQESFQRLQAAMEVLCFSSDQQHSIFRILAAILHLGNVYFNRVPASNNSEGVSIGNEGEINWTAYLLQLDPIQLTQALTVKLTETRDEKLSTPLNIDRALDVRDALSKALYMQLFSWLISQINRTIYKSDRDSSISLLDIYGFENFKNNKFEQMCINFANERLHTYFLSNVFRSEQSEYSKEKLEWNENVGAQLDNQPVIDLLTKRPHGLFHLLDDESCFPKGTDETFLQKCHYNHIENPFYGKPRMHNPDFCIRHFAGPVWYEVPGFLDKNRDVLKGNLVDLLVESQNPMISQMFKLWKGGNVSNNGTIERTGTTKPRTTTVVAGLNESLNSLVQKMNKSNPHFVRCLKPNSDKLSNNFDTQLVLDQVKCLGVLDTVRIRRLGYPIRYRFSDFVDKYQCLIPKREFIGKTDKLSCQHILNKQAPQHEDQCQIGVTKVFLKDGLSEYLDKCRDRRLQFAATLIQKNVKAYLHKKKYKRMKRATIKLQSCLRGWRARNRFSEMKSDLFRDAEQEAKHSRQLQMYEKMRNGAIKVDEKTSRNHAITGVNHLEIPADLSFNLNTMEEWDVINRQERVVRSSGDVTLVDRHLTIPHDLHNYPFAKFAQTYFKGHLWQMRREPITTPFLPKDNDDDFKDSLMIFKLILRYMNDINLSSTQEAMLANYIVQKGISNEVLRDEIYVQLVNQTHGNANPANQERGWWLIGLCASAFPPSAGLFKFLLNYVMNGECDQYRVIIHKKLLQSIHSDAATNRRYPPCLLEHKTVQQKGKMALDGRLADGTIRKCQVEAWTTANEFAGLVLKQKGVHDARGWSVSFDSPDVEIQLNGSDYLLDVLSYYELPRDFPALKSEYIIWAKPMSAEKREAKLQKLTLFNEPAKDKNINGKPNGMHSAADKKMNNLHPIITDKIESNAAELKNQKVKMNGQERKVENNVQPRNVQELNTHKDKLIENKENFKEQLKQQSQEYQPPTADFTSVKHMKQTQSSIASQRLPNEVPDAVLPSGARSSIMTDYNDPLYARTRILPSEYSVRSMASHVRNVAIPSKNSDVDKFLDDLFEPVLHDTTLEDLYEANSLAASIKGGGDSFGQQQGIATTTNFQQSQVPGFSLVPTMNQPMVMMVPMDAMRMFNMQTVANGMMANAVANQANGMDFSTLNRGFSNQNNNMPTFMSANQFSGTNAMQAGQFAGLTAMQAGQFATMQQAAQFAGMSPMQPGQFAAISPMQTGQFSAVSPMAAGMSPMSPSGMTQMSFIPMQMPSMFPMNMASNGMMGNNGYSMNHGSMSGPIITSPGTSIDNRGESNRVEHHSPQSIPPEPTYPPPAPIPPQPEGRAPHPPYSSALMDERANTVRVGNVRWPPPREPDAQESDNFLEFKRRQKEKRDREIYGNSYRNGYDEEDFYDAQRKTRMFIRGPPTTITEETSEGSDIEQRNGLIAGVLKPSANNARYVGPIQQGYVPQNYTNGNLNDYEQQPTTGHQTKDIIRSVRDGTYIPEGYHNEKNYEAHQPAFVTEKTVRLPDPAVSPVPNGNKPPQPVPPSLVPMSIPPEPVRAPPNKLQFGRYQNEEQRRQEEALMKLKENSKKLPPPIDKVVIKRTFAPSENAPNTLPSAQLKYQPMHDTDVTNDTDDDDHQTSKDHGDSKSVQKMDREISMSKTIADRVAELKEYEAAKHAENLQKEKDAKDQKDKNDQRLMDVEEQKREDSSSNVFQNGNRREMFQSPAVSNGNKRPQMTHPPADYDDDSMDHRIRNGHRNEDTPSGVRFSNQRTQRAAGAPDRFYLEDQNGFRQPHPRMMDDGFDDWIQEDIQLPPYRENKYYYEGRSVPMNELYPNNLARPFDYDVGLMKAEDFSPMDVPDEIEWAPPPPPEKGIPLYPTKDRKKTSVLTYDNTPWNLRVRKELFYPNETVDEDEVLDLIFYQIINDCLDPNPFRIKRNERDQVLHQLRSYDLEPHSLQNAKVPNSLKRSVMDTARAWPLYFCKLFPVVEDRESEYVAQLLGVSETGIRLVIRSYANVDEPLKVLDHFDFEDIDRAELSQNNLLVLTTLNGLQVRVFTPKAEQIKTLVEEFLFGPNQFGKDKQYVRAVSDYITKEPNLLNFRKGDIIQLITNMQESYMGSGWLYGKLNNRYGNFPADYVESLTEPHVPQDNMAALITDMDNSQMMAPANGVANGGTVGPPKGKLTMMEFAMMYFRQAPQKYDIVKTEDGNGGTLKVPGKKSKKEWTWKEIADMVKFTKTPIQSSLLKLETAEHTKVAIECFINIMMYMGDYPLKKDMTLADPVYKLLTVCEKRPPLRDEVYCQIIKQTTNNKSSKPDSAILGWRLFSIFTAYFDCSEVLKPYLIKYLSEAANDTRRAYHGTAMISLQNLKQTIKYGGRKNLLSFREIESITNGKNLKRQVYHLPGGTKKVINTKSVTVVEEVIQELCQELNIRSPLEQQEFCLCYVIESENVMKLLSNDEYILDITTDLEYKKKDYFLLLKRTVWIHPLRLDNELYIDVTFFQVVPDYLEGLLVIMRSAETISATFMDDIARLGALLHSADEHWDGQPVNSRTVAQVLPRIVQNLRHISLEQWADRVNAKLRQLPANINTTQARAKFLDILQTWPLFGSTFFYITNVSDSRIQDECLLAINKHGVQFLHIVTHETILEFRLNEILSTHKVTAGHPMGGPPMQFLDLKVGNLLQQRVLSLQTEQGAEISRLLGQYIYVDSQNRGFIQGDGGSS